MSAASVIARSASTCAIRYDSPGASTPDSIENELSSSPFQLPPLRTTQTLHRSMSTSTVPPFVICSHLLFSLPQAYRLIYNPCSGVGDGVVGIGVGAKNESTLKSDHSQSSSFVPALAIQSMFPETTHDLRTSVPLVVALGVPQAVQPPEPGSSSPVPIVSIKVSPQTSPTASLPLQATPDDVRSATLVNAASALEWAIKYLRSSTVQQHSADQDGERRMSNSKCIRTCLPKRATRTARSSSSMNLRRFV